MPPDRILNFYLDARKRDMLAAGKGIYGLIAQAVEAEGWTVTPHDRADPVTGPGHHLVDNDAVLAPCCLVLRLCHMEPFYRIEATNDRWHWEVVDQKFQPRPGSEWFLNYWQQRIFDGLTITEGGYIFMPLQGKLLERRHFQARSPVDMIAATLQADPTRRILATLHPKESYSAEELAALQSFGPRFELRTQPSKPLLAGCDYVVTENSALAFSGFFARKPAVLFAEIDFHHIAGSVPRLGVAEAFRVVTRPQSYAGYLHWFLRDRAISAWSEDCKTKIVARMRGLGWPI